MQLSKPSEEGKTPYSGQQKKKCPNFNKKETDNLRGRVSKSSFLASPLRAKKGRPAQREDQGRTSGKKKGEKISWLTGGGKIVLHYVHRVELAIGGTLLTPAKSGKETASRLTLGGTYRPDFLLMLRIGGGNGEFSRKNGRKVLSYCRWKKIGKKRRFNAKP